VLPPDGKFGAELLHPACLGHADCALQEDVGIRTVSRGACPVRVLSTGGGDMVVHTIVLKKDAIAG